MTNEIAFFLIMIISLLCVFGAGLVGKKWLLSSVIILALVSSITAGKLVEVFSFTTSIATPMYAGIFLATDSLSEIYSKDEAKKAIWIGLYANVFLITLGLLVTYTPAVQASADIANALEVIFNFIPRLVFAGLIAFVIAQRLDIEIFHYLREKFDKGRWFDLAIRNNGSTVISQGLDSMIVYFLAFSELFGGNIPTSVVWQMVLVAWVVKIIVAICDTPFLYLLKKLSTNNTNA